MTVGEGQNQRCIESDLPISRAQIQRFRCDNRSSKAKKRIRRTPSAPAALRQSSANNWKTRSRRPGSPTTIPTGRSITRRSSRRASFAWARRSTRCGDPAGSPRRSPSPTRAFSIIWRRPSTSTASARKARSFTTRKPAGGLRKGTRMPAGTRRMGMPAGKRQILPSRTRVEKLQSRVNQVSLLTVRDDCETLMEHLQAVVTLQLPRAADKPTRSSRKK